jgi:tRNA nucleotidyltransferase (CCA-adding enzyme)
MRSVNVKPTISRELPIPKELGSMLESLSRVTIDNKIVKPYLVGGCVRDWLLGEEPKDFDIEVYGCRYEALTEILSQYGKVDLVGKSFAVIKTTLPSGETYDFSLPRKDNKNGSGHKGFDIEIDPFINEEEGAKRRDLTINALSWCPKRKSILDFFGGLKDLEDGILKHTTEQFGEDPLRALRLAQFSARFGFTPHPKTSQLCRELFSEAKTLPKERVREEIEKFLLKGQYHLKGFETLKEIGWLNLFEELKALDGLPQDREFHPEGDVLTHTAHCLTALKDIKSYKELEKKDQMVCMLGVLCHDLGKSTTTFEEYKEKLNRVAIVSPGHDIAGVAPTKSLLNKIQATNYELDRVPLLVEYHMAYLNISQEKKELEKFTRKLASKLNKCSIEMLSIVVEADHSGRPPLKKGLPKTMEDVLSISIALNCSKKRQEHLLRGEDILNSGIAQGKAIGIIERAAYEAQINGEFQTKDKAIDWFKKNRTKLLENNKCGPQRLVTNEMIRSLGIKPSKEFGELHRRGYEEQLDGNIKTKEDALKWAINASKLFLQKDID